MFNSFQKRVSKICNLIIIPYEVRLMENVLVQSCMVLSMEQNLDIGLTVSYVIVIPIFDHR